MIDRILTALRGIACPRVDSILAEEMYEKAVEDFFASGKAFCFWKGRIALYAILKAMGVGEGDEVIVPGYTCVMVSGPVVYAGAKPVYADIDPRTYNLRLDEVEAKITPRTKAILVQHTYGMPAPVREIKAIADSRSIPVIEDCCHTFGGRLDGKLLGTFGVAAFFSSQWNKPFSTGLGGLALVHDGVLAEAVAAQQRSFRSASRLAAFMLACQTLVYEMVVFPSTTAKITQLFRWMTKKGLVVGSSSKAEFKSAMPKDYARRATPLQCRLGRLEVARMGDNLARRHHAVEQYIRGLSGMGYAIPPVSEFPEAMMLRFPLRVANKAEVLEKAAAYGVEVGSWFECPLHPAETDHETFGYFYGDCPIAEEAAAQVVNLPVHRRVTSKDIDKTLAFVSEVCRPAPAQA